MSTGIDILHDRYYDTYWVFSVPSVKKWSKFGLVEGLRTLLKGGVAVAEEGIAIRRALPHGHAAAVLGPIRAIGLDRLLGKPTDQRLAPLPIPLIATPLASPPPQPPTPPTLPPH